MNAKKIIGIGAAFVGLVGGVGYLVEKFVVVNKIEAEVETLKNENAEEEVIEAAENKLKKHEAARDVFSLMRNLVNLLYAVMSIFNVDLREEAVKEELIEEVAEEVL